MAGNYRPITILSITYKLFSRLLLQRVKPILDNAQTVDQASFRSGYSCSDHSFCLAQIQEKAHEWQQEVWVVAIDFVKAFDSVDHAPLFDALRSQALADVYVELLEAIYSGQKGSVRVDCESRQFCISRGVRQGDPMSPLLFNAALEQIVAKCKKGWSDRRFGINIKEGSERLTNLRFADDLLLVATSLADLSEMIQNLSHEASALD